MTKVFEFDVALSYAGPDRRYAERLAELLQAAGLAVFFDLFEEASILGTRQAHHRRAHWGRRSRHEAAKFLQDVYENKARYCVVLISEHYASRIWPRHEIQTAFNRVAREKGEYLLPIRLDDAMIEGLPSDLAYIRAVGRGVEEIAAILRKKVSPQSDPSEETVQVYSGRRTAKAVLLNEISMERHTITLLTGSGWIMTDPEMFGALRRASIRRAIRLRVMLPNPDSMEARAEHELRAPGQVAAEVKNSSHFIRRNLTSAEVRMFSVTPVYSSVCLSEVIMYLPYLHTRGSFSAPAFTFRRSDTTEGLFGVMLADLDRLWQNSRSVVDLGRGDGRSIS